MNSKLSVSVEAIDRLTRPLKSIASQLASLTPTIKRYISQRVNDWAISHQITLIYIQPSKPTQNAYIERFNASLSGG